MHLKGRLAAGGVLFLAALVRAPFVLPSLPYLAYMDEGHVLHHAAVLARNGGWDPGWYGYPSLTLYLIAGAFRVLAFAFRIGGGRDLLSAVQPNAAFYDFVMPPELIVVGRVVVLLAGLGIVALGMALARRLAGERAGLVAGILLALCPALVQRSPIVIVDTVAAFFALGALFAALRVEGPAESSARETQVRWSLAAGALSGLAAASKYPVGAVMIAVLGTIALLPAPALERIKLGAAAVAAACVGAVVGMPALVLKPAAVFEALREQARLYGDPALMFHGAAPVDRSAVRDSFRSYEMGAVLPFFGVAAFLVILALGKKQRRQVGPWIAFAAVLLVSVLGFPFQPFRNLLVLVPLLVVAVPVAIDSALPPGRRRGLAGAATCVALAATFIPGLLLIRQVYGRGDSRVTAVGRLAETLGPQDRVLVLRELAVLPAELARLGAPVTVVPWYEARAAAETGSFTRLVFGDLDPSGYVPGAGENLSELPAFRNWAAGLPEAFRVGSARTPMPPVFWRSAEELLVVARLPHR
ncbi:MAG TPA: glycosyltransferase family 39 protein [Thermoanaerobaculia bacterium]|nr:glycosyltransferase family 39 protein [Thermoanaerobaculia bacterium]